jgi:hypothetical protein
VHWTAPGKQVMLWPSRIPPPGNLPAHLVGCGRPGKKPTTPPRLNHFTCYPVKLAPGTPPYNPPPVMLKDEFATKGAVKATVLAVRAIDEEDRRLAAPPVIRVAGFLPRPPGARPQERDAPGARSYRPPDSVATNRVPWAKTG